MTIIQNISDKRFSFNGIEYFKNYITKVAFNSICIINAYDSKDVLLDWTLFDQIEVNGVVYASVDLLQTNIIDVCYVRNVGINTTEPFTIKKAIRINALIHLNKSIEDVTDTDIVDYINTLGLETQETIDDKVYNVLYEVELYELPYNFDITADWANIDGFPVTDEASFEAFLSGYQGNDLTNIQISNFELINGRLMCELFADGTILRFDSIGMTNMNCIGDINGLQGLILVGNQLTEFNPIYPLPISLENLDLKVNQFTTSGYTASEEWATNQSAFTNPCTINFNGNPDSVTGTNLETILLTKNTVIIA